MGRSGCLPLLAWAGALTLWYTYTSTPVRFNTSERPERAGIQSIERAFGGGTFDARLPTTIETRTGPVKTDSIDFSGHFDIQTERYHLIKDDDWFVSRGIGWLNSQPRRLFFWDCDVSNGPDGATAKSVLTRLENDKSITGLTVRLGYNEALRDGWRMMTEKPLRERNGFLARLLLGVPTTLCNELLAELGRGDYYNPMTRTAVIYSNVESIAYHEIGHHKDYARFSRDWPYSLSRLLPPAMLYQEVRASDYAKEMLAPEQNYEFYRYLIPAFATYVVASAVGLKRFLYGKNKDGEPRTVERTWREPRPARYRQGRHY